MELRLLITIYSILFKNLLLKDASLVDAVILILPHEYAGLQVKQCSTTEKDCKRYLTSIQQYMIHVLNNERSAVSKGKINKMPVATNMLHLEQDADLENRAQEYAESCVSAPDMEGCSVASQNDGGEVIIFVRKHKMDDVISRSAFATYRASWALSKPIKEIKNFEERDLRDMMASYNSARTEGTLQYISKIYHASVWKAGCGIADYFINMDEFKEVIICLLGPPNLQDGEVIYIPGCAPCTRCPEGTICNNDPTAIDSVNILCKVQSPNTIIPRNYELPRAKICNKVEDTVPSDAIEVPLDAIGNALQECTGERLCSPGWKHYGRYSSILVKQKCSSAAIFRDKIHIQSDSCFQFYYTKRTNTSHLNSEVIAFAFQANDSDKRIKEVKTEANGHFIYLDISWTEVDIYVGFGTRSLSHRSDYEITVKNHLVTSGKCLG